MRKRFFLLLLFATHSYALFIPHHVVQDIEPPWFTGPLFASSPRTVPAGHFNVEPYVYAVANTGNYGHHWKSTSSPTFWNNNVQLDFTFGLTHWLDFQFNPILFYNTTQGVSDWELGDMPIGFDIQIINWGVLSQSTHALKLILKETLPIGQYQKLNPNKKGTDVGGGGSWQTSFGLAWGSLYYLGRERFLNIRLTCQYTLPAPVSVKKLNVYGGGPGTHGTVYPAQSFQIDNAFELNLTQRWAIAMDFIAQWNGKTRFKGKTSLTNTSPPSAQFSLAPALEYNLSADVGFIAGPWFTIAGRNAIQFTGAVAAFNYYH